MAFVTYFSTCLVGGEREALTKIYQELGGDSWRNNYGWLSEKPLSEWHGIKTAEGSVVTIELPGNELIGNFPDVFDSLPNLQELDLRWNRINGSIPESIGFLRDLTTLLLKDNRFSGYIPNSIGYSSKLVRVDLAYNELNGTLPQELGYLDSLRTLGLQGNRFESIPINVICEMISLENIIVGVEIIIHNDPAATDGFLKNDDISEVVDDECQINVDKDVNTSTDKVNRKYFNGLGLRTESTVLFPQGNGREIANSILQSIEVRNGLLSINDAVLPLNSVDLDTMIDSVKRINMGLRESGLYVYTLRDLERVLELDRIYRNRNSVELNPQTMQSMSPQIDVNEIEFTGGDLYNSNYPEDDVNRSIVRCN